MNQTNLELEVRWLCRHLNACALVDDSVLLNAHVEYIFCRIRFFTNCSGFVYWHSIIRCILRYEMTFGLADWRCSEDALWVPTDAENDLSRIPICSPGIL